MSTTESTSVRDDDHFPVTIRRSRSKAAFEVVWAVAIGVLAVSEYHSNVAHPHAWSSLLIPLDLLAVPACGLWAIRSAIEMVRPPRLILDHQGITERSLLQTRTTPWRDVDNFRSFGGFPFWPSYLIAFDYVGPRAHPILRALSGRHTLGPGWVMKRERLIALLNAGRDRWVGSPQAR